jgi:hypothetical protein
VWNGELVLLRMLQFEVQFISPEMRNTIFSVPDSLGDIL